jgi:hypothetical protein
MKNLSNFTFSLFLTFSFIALMLTGCNKNQKAVKKLSGEWSATKILESNGNTVTDLKTQGVNATFKFNKCKLKNDEYCEYSLTIVTTIGSITNTQTENGFYKVTDDGAKMIQTDNITTGTPVTVDIVNLTKKKATLKIKGNNNYLIEYELTKTS